MSNKKLKDRLKVIDKEIETKNAQIGTALAALQVDIEVGRTKIRKIEDEVRSLEGKKELLLELVDIIDD